MHVGRGTGASRPKDAYAVNDSRQVHVIATATCYQFGGRARIRTNVAARVRPQRSAPIRPQSLSGGYAGNSGPPTNLLTSSMMGWRSFVLLGTATACPAHAGSRGKWQALRMMIDVEAEFRRLVALARVLPTRLEDEFAANRDLSVVHIDDFPTVTVLKRLHWASVQFESAVVLLEDHRTAHGCMLLLRGLLEVWADFLFMADKKDDQDEQRKRSVAVELAAAQQMVHTFGIEGIADPEHAAASLERAQRRVSHLQELMSREGWNLRARRYGQLDQWLEKSGLDWPSKMYRGFSDAAHQHLPEWAGEPGNEPTWQLRAVPYEQCLVIHGNIGMLGLHVAQPQGTGAFVAAVDELRHDPILAEAFRGELD
jgi:hypothetical protein